MNTETGYCAYCKRTTQVKVWKETDELVCFECRIELLETEFEV